MGDTRMCTGSGVCLLTWLTDPLASPTPVPLTFFGLSLPEPLLGPTITVWPHAHFQGDTETMPPLTMTERILARHSNRDQVQPGDNIWIDVDVLMTHDVCGPGTIGIFKQHFGKDARVWDRDKVVIIPDHYIFTADK